jgi:hypothetical protein
MRDVDSPASRVAAAGSDFNDLLHGPRCEAERHVCGERPAAVPAYNGTDEIPAEQAEARMRAQRANPRPRHPRPTIAGLRRQGIGERTARVVVSYRLAKVTAAVPPARSRERRASVGRRRGSRRGSSRGSSAGSAGDSDGEPEPPGGRQAPNVDRTSPRAKEAAR